MQQPVNQQTSSNLDHLVQPTLVRSINVREYKAVEDVSSKDPNGGPILVCRKGGYAFYIEWKGDIETGKWHHSTVKEEI